MDATINPGYSNHTGSVRILNTPEELAEAIQRAREFERRNAEFMASRAQRHEAALARFPSNVGTSSGSSSGSRWITPLTAATSAEQIPSLPESA
jgi:hypothetical protein